MTANPYRSYTMDHDKEKSGVVIVENDHFRIKGARAGGRNTKYDTVREALTKPHRRAIQTNTLPKELSDRLNAELAAGALVVEWATNETPGASEPKWKANTIHDPATMEVVKVTPQLIIDTFLKYDELYTQFAVGCGDIENYLDKSELEADAKN